MWSGRLLFFRPCVNAVMYASSMVIVSCMFARILLLYDCILERSVSSVTSLYAWLSLYICVIISRVSGGMFCIDSCEWDVI